MLGDGDLRNILIMLVVIAAMTWCTLGCALNPNVNSNFNSPTLTFSANPSVLAVNAPIVYTAKISGIINWCPSSIIWYFDDGHEEEPIDGCMERTWQKVHTFKSNGKHWAWVSMKTEDRVIANTSPITVQIGGSSE